MRVGINPYKLEISPVYQPKDITVAILVYIPHLSGYFENKFDILRISIDSLLKHTDLPHDLLIFDNGSCPEVIRYLLDLYQRGIVRFLILSRENLGVLGAYNAIFTAAPGRYIAYADDDIFYYPNWLSSQVQILDTFPNAGMVSGLPTWQGFANWTASTVTLAQSDPTTRLEKSKGWPLDWAEDYCETIGWDLDGFTKLCKDIDVIELKKNGVSAFATCTHCQFVARKEAATIGLPIETGGRAMWKVWRFDEQMDKAGFMRLSTVRPYVRHMGNRLSDKTKDLVVQYELDVNLPTSPTALNLPKPVLWFLKTRRVRLILGKLYTALFKLITCAEDKGGETK